MLVQTRTTSDVPQLVAQAVIFIGIALVLVLTFFGHNYAVGAEQFTQFARDPLGPMMSLIP